MFRHRDIWRALDRLAAQNHLSPSGLAKAGGGGCFDDAGFPIGAGWDKIVCPNIDDPNAYALAITGDSMEPVIRAGAIVIVSPGAAIRRGDRVAVKTRDGDVMAKELVRRSAQRIELKSLNKARRDPVLEAKNVAWLARILWVSQ